MKSKKVLLILASKIPVYDRTIDKLPLSDDQRASCLKLSALRKCKLVHVVSDPWLRRFSDTTVVEPRVLN